MALSLKNDLNVFFNPDDFATQAIINGTTAVGIFYEDYQEVDEGGAPVSGVAPALECATLAVTNCCAVQGSVVYVNVRGLAVVHGLWLFSDNDKYVIVNIKQDGTGVTMLILEKQ